MKSYTIKYQFFKVIKSFVVTAINYVEAIKEFLRLYKYYEKRFILRVLINQY